MISFICHCFDENKRNFFCNSKKTGMFAVTYIRNGKRRLANFELLWAFFMPK